MITARSPPQATQRRYSDKVFKCLCQTEDLTGTSVHESQCPRCLTQREHYNSGHFIQEVQPLSPIVQFTGNIFDIPFHP
ncbi:hypothetical protein TNCV_4039941 [Trichonephila clavipes]|nr:hypothetical protein TNCV_4039941 [Trichonephila clavipes]